MLDSHWPRVPDRVVFEKPLQVCWCLAVFTGGLLSEEGRLLRANLLARREQAQGERDEAVRGGPARRASGGSLRKISKIKGLSCKKPKPEVGKLR